MDTKQEAFLKQLRATFRVEAEEHIRALSTGLIELETAADTPQQAELIETLFREVHSFKGAARSVGIPVIESICQALESAFSALKRGKIALSTALCDVAHQAVDAVAQRVASMEEECSPEERVRTRELVAQLRQAFEGASGATAQGERTTLPHSVRCSPVGQAFLADPHRADKGQQGRADLPGGRSETDSAPMPASASDATLTTTPPHPHHAPEHPVLVDTVRISTGRLEPLLVQAEEMIAARMVAVQRVADAREMDHALAVWRAELTLWQNRLVGGAATRATDILAWNETHLTAIQAQAARATLALEHDLYALGRMVDDHLEAMKSVLMLPVSSLTQGFAKLVRDLAREQGKEVGLVLRGVELEMDKRILDELKEPLIHLLRNSIDHGIEMPEVRARRDKPSRATVTVTFEARQSDQAEIAISDDGAGIDLDALRSAAVKGGALSPEAAEHLPPHETAALAFLSGVSTNAMITDISGRGLGLAIVRERVERLGGVVTITTQPHTGTTFRLLVPLTHATFKGILVRERDQVFVLPGVNVERVVRVAQRDIKTVESQATIRHDGRVLALVTLADVLGVPTCPTDAASVAPDYRHVLVVASGERRIALQVDEVLGQQDVLVKGLGPQLRHVRGIAGATILSTGKVAAVLNVSDVIQSAARGMAVTTPPAVAVKPPVRSGRILVAEDSITSRALLRNILETGGYHVTVAVDGLDAFTQLRSGEFDLVVSDVDMPRMSGFELTGRIRADGKLAEMPVILVTSLDSREDREHGVDVGANAYIVKSSFEQSNLLEAVRRLI